jgi:hypothetical protein|tara:strand:+ start:1182 stop:1547 length:366 start_codon:yes stop_codon:yes gene_type:complete
MKPKPDRGNIVRFCLLWTLFTAWGSATAVLPTVDGQNKAENRLYWLATDQQQNQEGSVSVKINHDLIFSTDSPLRLANQKPVEVKLKLPGVGETIAMISEFNFKNDREYSYIGNVEGKIKV